MQQLDTEDALALKCGTEGTWMFGSCMWWCGSSLPDPDFRFVRRLL